MFPFRWALASFLALVLAGSAGAQNTSRFPGAQPSDLKYTKIDTSNVISGSMASAYKTPSSGNVFSRFFGRMFGSTPKPPAIRPKLSTSQLPSSIKPQSPITGSVPKP